MKSSVITRSHDQRGLPSDPQHAIGRVHQLPRADVGMLSEVHPRTGLGLGCDNAKSQGDDLVNNRVGGGSGDDGGSGGGGGGSGGDGGSGGSGGSGVDGDSGGGVGGGGDDGGSGGGSGGNQPVLSSEPRVECLESIEVLESHLVASNCVKVEGQCWECVNTYKGNKGLKVHLARSKSCGLKAESTIVERSSVLVQSGNPLSIAGPEPRVPDSSHEPSVSSDSPESQVSIRLNTMNEEAARLQAEVGVRLPIKWPAMKEKDRWESFESCVLGQISCCSYKPFTVRLDLLRGRWDSFKPW